MNAEALAIVLHAARAHARTLEAAEQRARSYEDAARIGAEWAKLRAAIRVVRGAPC